MATLARLAHAIVGVRRQVVLAHLSFNVGCRTCYDEDRDAGDSHHEAEHWEIDLSASCTAAYPARPPTTKTPPGHTEPTPQGWSLLDQLRPWAVSTPWA